MVDIKPRYLVMVTGSANNNKYYRMIPNGSSWTAEYGRVGANPQKREYSMSQWSKKYNEKIAKGYVDQTDLVEDLIQVEKPKSEYKEIENKVIAEIVERLQSMARKAISENYTISSNKVTQAMVDEAQDILTSLLTIETVEKFNETLLILFTTIPRKMSNVRDFLAKSDKDFSDIIQKEQDLLDVMKGQVVQKQIIDDAAADENDTQYENTILEQLGLVFEECDANDIATIKASLGEISGKFHKAWKVTNLKTQERFDNFVKLNEINDTRLLFHGSRNENWWSIINTGLVLKPTNAVITGKLYGYGIYFAPKARKSLGYTSLSGSYWAHGSSNSGFMALMDVAYGVPYDVYDFNSKYYDMNYDNLQKFKLGANCLHAHAGANLGGYSSLKNDEIIVYKEEQCTIKYLVELR